MDEPALTRAEQLLLAAEVDAPRVLTEALAAVEDAGDDVDDDAGQRSLLLRAAGLAARALGRSDEARRHLSAAIDAARDGGHDAAAGHAHISRAGLEAMLGAFPEAERDLDRAAALLTGTEATHVAVQRATIAHHAGDLARAAVLYDEALALTRRHGPVVEEARVLANRSLLALHRGSYGLAEQDLRRAARLQAQLGHHEQLMSITHNLGYLAACQGRLPEALEHYEQMRRAAEAAGTPPYTATADRADALTMAGLVDQAAALGREAARHFEQRGHLTDAADALVAASRADVAAGRPDRAVEALDHALRLSPTDHRHLWRAVAQSALVEATLSAGEGNEGHGSEPENNDGSDNGLDTGAGGDGPGRDGESLIAEAVAVLEANGAVDYALRSRLVSARAALARPDADAARQRLEALRPRLRRMTADLRAQYWLDWARLYRHLDDRTRARRAFGHALANIRRHRALLPWLETATSLGPTGSAICAEALTAALDGAATTASILRWIDAGYETRPLERSEGGGDDVLQARLTAARLAAQDLAETVAADGDPVGVRQAMVSVRRAEREVAAAAVSTRSSWWPRAVEPFDVRSALAALDGVDLLEFGVADDAVVAISHVDGRLSRHRPIDRAAVRRALGRVRALVRDSWRAESVTPGLAEAADDLDRLVIPAVIGAGQGPLVIVAGPEFGALPFGLLPSLLGRPFVQAPSLAATATLSTAHRPAPGQTRALFVAGPGLDHAETEVTRAAATTTGAQVLDGPQATVDAVLAGFDHDVVHLAAHGEVRDEAPMFSALRLADGPLLVHALQQAPAMPRLLVLSACNVGRTPGRGPNSAGLPAALLSLGVGTVVASPIEVPDDATAAFMVAFHQQVSRGHSAAAVLADLRRPTETVEGLLASVFTGYSAAV